MQEEVQAEVPEVGAEGEVHLRAVPDIPIYLRPDIWYLVGDIKVDLRSLVQALLL